MPPLLRPPGPEDRGILGNFPMGSRDPLALFARWAAQYGDIFHYRVLCRHVYFLNSPELIQEVLVANYRNFIKGEAVRYNRRIFGNGLVINEGASWLRQRRLIQPAFHREKIDSYGETMASCTERTIGSWRDGEARDIHREMMRLALEIVAKVLFNIEITSHTEQVSVALNTLMELSSGPRMLLPPLLRLFPTPKNLRWLRAARQLHRIVDTLIRERRADSNGTRSGDLLALLLEARDEDDKPMPDGQLRDEVMTLLLTGHETTAVSLSWTWYLLAKHPEEQEELHAELLAVLKGRSPRASDLPRLPYTERILREAMRLYPPVWAVVRNPVNGCEIGGFRVPAGATVMMSPWVMHRDPRYYGEPERFRPDRWLEPRAGEVPKLAYFPFGAGPRSCIGASFAGMEAALVLATIAQRFSVHMETEDRVEPLPAITLRPRQGVRVILSRRPDDLRS